jgi:heme exporter protein A
VLDEPTISLDAASVGLFVAAVRAHLAGGGAALMATHIDLGLAEAAVLDLAPFRATGGGFDGIADGGFGGGFDGGPAGAFG